MLSAAPATSIDLKSNGDLLTLAADYIVSAAMEQADTITIGFFPNVNEAVRSHLAERNERNALSFREVPADELGNPRLATATTEKLLSAANQFRSWAKLINNSIVERGPWSKWTKTNEVTLVLNCAFYGLSRERAALLLASLPSRVTHLLIIDQTDNFDAPSAGVRTLEDVYGRSYEAECLDFRQLLAGAGFGQACVFLVPSPSKSLTGVVVAGRTGQISPDGIVAYHEARRETPAQRRVSVNKARIAQLSKVIAPRRLIIEPSSKCNFLCPKCVYPVMKRPQGFIDAARMDAFLGAWTKEYGEFDLVDLTGSGEALFNKNLVEVVSSISTNMPSSRITVTSNLALLNPQIADQLLQAGLRDWQVSFDSADRDEFNEFTKSKKYERVVENIKMLFARMAADGNERNRLTIVAHRPFDENYESGMQAIKDLLAGYYHAISCTPYQSLNGRISGERYTASESKFYDTSVTPIVCNYLWDDLVVVHTGEVRLCCSDMFDSEISFGNIFTDTPQEIVNNAERAYFKRQQVNGVIDDLYLCKTCHAPFAPV